MKENHIQETVVQIEPQRPKGKGLGIASLTVGVIGLIMSFCIGFIGIIIAVAGFILGIVGIVQKQGALAIAGTVLSVIALLIGCAWFFIFNTAVDAVKQSLETNTTIESKKEVKENPDKELPKSEYLSKTKSLLSEYLNIMSLDVIKSNKFTEKKESAENLIADLEAITPPKEFRNLHKDIITDIKEASLTSSIAHLSYSISGENDSTYLKENDRFASAQGRLFLILNNFELNKYDNF